MSTFVVNGHTVTAEKNKKLLRFLRDDLGLTSVKDGCSEGACGACTVIIDGVTCKACVPDTDKLEGRNIITVEGLSDWEKEMYTFAYAEAGAVQCGFCIPGMVMCTKALLDRNLNPTDDQIRYALRNNYCRCTGYVKIIDAIKLAAQIKRTGVIPKPSNDDWKIGSRVQRLDAEEKVLGTGKYPDDYYMEGMLYGSALRSKYPRPRAVHRYLRRKGIARSGGCADSRGYTGGKQDRPSQARSVYHDTRGRPCALSGRRYRPGCCRGQGDP